MTEDLKRRFENSNSPLKASEIIDAGYTYKEIVDLEKSGKIKRFKNGYYTCPEVNLPEEDMIIGLFPDGVLTMESALYYHGYLSERPFHWSIAISKNVSKSRFKMDYPIVHPFYTEEKVLELGVKKIKIHEKDVQIYEKDRLICDILKYEDKIDREDFKLGVLAYISDKEKNIQKLINYAKQRRVLKKVHSIIGPWL